MEARRVEGLVTEWTEGELLVAKPDTNEAHALNETAAIVFELADGQTTRAEMAAEVARRTELPVDESIVDLALADLVEAGLVTPGQAEPATITRRSLIRRLALPAAAAALLPIVETILMPSVDAAAPAPTPFFPPPPS